MNVAIIHDTVDAADAPDARDVLAQADAVSAALTALGHSSCRIACTLDLSAVQTQLQNQPVDLVFNLVESIGGQGRLIHLLPFCLEAMDLPYTGAQAQAIMFTSSKTLAKAWMAAAGIPTPAWIGPRPGDDGMDRGRDAAQSGTWIIKSVWEHASIGLGPHSLIANTPPEAMLALLDARARELGGSCFAEHFIDGREFNLSLLAGADGPEVLPPAEILFEGYSQAMPRIVDYRAKWDEAAYEYHHTPRRFDFDRSDTGLLERLETRALECWKHFGLNGYARVDFRVDPAGNPWVLEINTNPCLAPDAGFAAAVERSGIAYLEAIARILADAGSRA